MGLQLIKEDTLYLKEVTDNSYWEYGVKYVSETITYSDFEGIVDPYSKGETSLILPEGVSNDSAYLLYSDSTLKTHTSLEQESNLADIVYLSDPEADSTAVPYVVFDKAPYSQNAGFTLIESKHTEYLLVRENRL